MFVDLHQDVAYYFLTSLSPPPFDVDAEGRQSDLPKLRRAGADLVFAAVFPFVNAYGGWSPSLQLALEGEGVLLPLRAPRGEAGGEAGGPGLPRS